MVASLANDVSHIKANVVSRSRGSLEVRVDKAQMITHRLGFDDVPQAYDLFADPVASGALKVAVLRD
jgi:hypothetical protein